MTVLYHYNYYLPSTYWELGTELNALHRVAHILFTTMWNILPSLLLKREAQRISNFPHHLNIKSTFKQGVVVLPLIPGCGKWRQEDCKFEATWPI